MLQKIATTVMYSALAAGETAYANFDSGRLLVPFLQTITVTPHADDGSVFLSFSLANTLGSQIAVQSQWLPTDRANQLRGLLVNKQAVARFAVTVGVNARFTTSESAVQVQKLETKSTNSVVSLKGSGTALKIDIGPQGTTVGQSQTVLTRDQKQRFEGAFRQEISETWQVESDRDRSLLNERLDKYLQSAFTRMDVSLDDNFGKALSGLAAYGFSPTDLTPDELQRFGADLKQSYSLDKKTVSDVQLAAKADVIGVGGGSASANLKSEEHIKTLQDLGWKFEQQGNVRIPKSLEVYALNTQNLNQDISLNLMLKRLYRGFQPITTLVATDRAYLPTSIPEQQVVPVGTVVAYAGDPKDIPAGWLLCNGSEVERTRYPALAKVLGSIYGAASRPEVFKLPDYRGKFLRGQNHDAKETDGTLVDPDRDKRTPHAGSSGNAGNSVGSLEGDKIRQHRHQMEAELYAAGERHDLVPGKTNGVQRQTGFCLDDRCGDETRPKNVYVNYLVKY